MDETILRRINGTGLSDALYQRNMLNSFVSYILRHSPAAAKRYMRGPGFDGLDMGMLIGEGYTFVHLQKVLQHRRSISIVCWRVPRRRSNLAATTHMKSCCQAAYSTRDVKRDQAAKRAQHGVPRKTSTARAPALHKSRFAAHDWTPAIEFASERKARQRAPRRP